MSIPGTRRFSTNYYVRVPVEAIQCRVYCRVGSCLSVANHRTGPGASSSANYNCCITQPTNTATHNTRTATSSNLRCSATAAAQAVWLNNGTTPTDHHNSPLLLSLPSDDDHGECERCKSYLISNTKLTQMASKRMILQRANLSKNA